MRHYVIDQSCITDGSVLLRQHLCSRTKPYFCCFPHGDGTVPRFRSKIDWIDHEIQCHRSHYKWECSKCQESFPSRAEGESHLSTGHGLQKEDVSLKLAQDKLSSEYIKAVREEQCSFCLDKSFDLMEDFFTHIGRHMEALSFQVLDTIVPEAPCRFPWIPKVFQLPAQSWRKIYQHIFRSLAFSSNSGARLKPFNGYGQINVWNNPRQCFESLKALIDTGSDAHYICEAAVQRLSLRIRTVKPSVFQGIDGHKFFYSKMAEVTWQYVPKPWDQYTVLKSHNNVGFYVVPEVPGDLEVVISYRLIAKSAPLWIDEQDLIAKRALVSKSIVPEDKAGAISSLIRFYVFVTDFDMYSSYFGRRGAS